MLYMRKKGETYAIPYDEKIYDHTVYETFEIAEAVEALPEPELAPKKRRSKPQPVIPEEAPALETNAAAAFLDEGFNDE